MNGQLITGKKGSKTTYSDWTLMPCWKEKNGMMRLKFSDKMSDDKIIMEMSPKDQEKLLEMLNRAII